MRGNARHDYVSVGVKRRWWEWEGKKMMGLNIKMQNVISFTCGSHIKEWILLRWICILSTRMNINSTQIETCFGINQSWDAQNKGNMRNLSSFVREQGISFSIFHAHGFNMRVQLTLDDNESEEEWRRGQNLHKHTKSVTRVCWTWYLFYCTIPSLIMAPPVITQNCLSVWKYFNSQVKQYLNEDCFMIKQ